jgi:tetratricopeptide (TPR) repeat protein
MSPQILCNQAIEFHQRGNLVQAERLYLDILAAEPSNFVACHLLGVVRHQQGRDVEALELIGAALKINPDAAEALSNYGFVLKALGRFKEALASFDRAIAVNGNFAEAWNNRGIVLLDLERFDDALRSCDKSLEINSNYAEAWNNRGLALRQLSRLGAALSSYDKALAVRPDFPEALNNRGVTLLDLHRPEDALVSFDKALAIKPDFADALNNRGTILQNQMRFEEALACYDRALTIKPGFVDALNNRGAILQYQMCFEEALACYDQALTIKPNFADALNNRGAILQNQMRLEEALACCDQALMIKPDFADALNNRGAILQNLKRFEEARQSFDNAIAVDPSHTQAHLNKGLGALLMQQFDVGWQLFERREKGRASVRSRTYPQPVWTGAQDINGKILFLYAEEGLGDTIQFYRYAALAQARGARVILSIQDVLIRLVKVGCPGIEIIGFQASPEHIDFHNQLLSMPLAFGTDGNNIPAKNPYLWAEPDRVRTWANKIGCNGFRIGISWQGNKRLTADVGRSFPLRHFERLSKTPNVRLISLQKNAGVEQLLNMPFGMKVETFSGEFDIGSDAFIDTAAMMENLDLIITSDTAVAHLAGALGRPVWVALKYVPDWRWFLDRTDSPWYPTMRLFRQTSMGDWEGVFIEIQEQLEALVGLRD